MTRRGLILCLAPVAKAAQHDQLMERWNRFATVANIWTKRRNEGIVDLKHMLQSEELFYKMIQAEGWPRG